MSTSRNCVTHHFACDCREAEFAQVLKERDELRARVESIPHENSDAEVQRLRKKIMALMQWDSEKVERWFETPNPFFGTTPNHMLSVGRAHKVEAFVDARLCEELALLRGSVKYHAERDREAGEVRGFKRAVAKLREHCDHQGSWGSEEWADWLEARLRDK